MALSEFLPDEDTISQDKLQHNHRQSGNMVDQDIQFSFTISITFNRI